MDGESEGQGGWTARRSAFALALLAAVALALRLWTLDFGLPYTQEPDAHILGQIEMLSQPEVSDEELYFTAIYPHLLARLALVTGASKSPRIDPSSPDLRAHLAEASRLHVHVRALVAVLSLGMIVATFWIARSFLQRGWALFAAALVATSLLHLQFSQMARPHAAAGALTALAIAASLRLRRRGDLGSFTLAGLATALALACLQNAMAMLFAPLAAYLLRENARRRFLDARLLVPIALMALAVRLFWPFLFVPTPATAASEHTTPAATDHGPLIVLALIGALGTSGTVLWVLQSLRTGPVRRRWIAPVLLACAALLAVWLRGRTIYMGWQTIETDNFDGGGLRTVWTTLWYYEPVMLFLALAGAGIWALRKLRGGAPVDLTRRKDWLVVAAYALPYLLVLCLFNLVQQRFLIPLLPMFATVAAFGLREIVTRVVRSRWQVGAAASLALALPLAASLGYSGMRSRPQTLEQLAEWLRANVKEGEERVAIHLLYDVPLVREHANLFEPDGKPKGITFSPWLRYQRDRLDANWRGGRWKVESLYPERQRWPWIAKNADEFVGSLAADYVIVPGGDSGTNAMIEAVRAALARRGELVEELPHETRPPTSGLEGLDTPHFTYFVLTAHWFGPQLAVYRLRDAQEK